MGIINSTPDSFSDGGENFSVKDAFDTASKMVSYGVDILDVGGESTKPYADEVSLKEELDRTIPLIEEISGLGVPVSIDTYKTEVVEKAVAAGASMVNDVFGLRTPGMPDLISELDIPVCIMHMQGAPKNMQDNPSYTDVVEEVLEFFEKQIQVALTAGVKEKNIILDPGIGFGKTLSHNLTIFREIKSFSELGYPVLVGHSRKSFIGDILDIPVEERLTATISVTQYLYNQGIDYVRVHDVKENIEAIKIIKAIQEV